MAERYNKLFSLPESLYEAGAPVIVAAGALLKDNQTGKVLAQLKLKSISTKTIKAVKVKLFPLDTVNKPLDGEAIHEYLDLNINRDGEFGQKNAIPLSNASTRAFSVEVTEVDFADNSVWISAGEGWEPLPTLQAAGDGELSKQYRLHFGDKAQYKIISTKNIWRCACGGVNSSDEETCHICGNRLSELLACDWTGLATEKDQRLAKEKAEQEAQAAAEKAAAEASAKKTKKILSIFVPAAAVCIAAVLLITKVVIPNSYYNKAKALLDAGEYPEAIAAFEALGGHKDSAEQIEIARAAIAEEENESAYEKAKDWLDAGNYDTAIVMFKALGDYKDSAHKLEEAQAAKAESVNEAAYQRASSFLDAESYELAIEAFEELGDFSDSAARIKEAKYQWAISLLGWGDNVNYDNVEKAHDLFVELENYKDSKEYLKKFSLKPILFVFGKNTQMGYRYDMYGNDGDTAGSYEFTDNSLEVVSGPDYDQKLMRFDANGLLSYLKYYNDDYHDHLETYYNYILDPNGSIQEIQIKHKKSAKWETKVVYTYNPDGSIKEIEYVDAYKAVYSSSGEEYSSVSYWSYNDLSDEYSRWGGDFRYKYENGVLRSIKYDYGDRSSVFTIRYIYVPDFKELFIPTLFPEPITHASWTSVDPSLEYNHSRII